MKDDKLWAHYRNRERHFFHLRPSMLYHWATETLWWERPITKFIYTCPHVYRHMSCILLGSAISVVSCFVNRSGKFWAQ